MLEMFKVNKNSNNNFQENKECFFFLNFLFINAFSNLFFLQKKNSKTFLPYM